MKIIEIKTLRKELKKIGWNIKSEMFSFGLMGTIFNIEYKKYTMGDIYSPEIYETAKVKSAYDIINSYSGFKLVDKHGNKIMGVLNA